MKNKLKIAAVVLIGSLMAVGLVLTGCEPGANCTGSGECTVTIDQGTSGLYVDYDSPRSSCGKSATWNNGYWDNNGRYHDGYYSGGCKVQNNMDDHRRTYGTHSCDC